VLRKISIAQTEITKTQQKPLSDHFDSLSMRERRCAACYAQAKFYDRAFCGTKIKASEMIDSSLIFG